MQAHPPAPLRLASVASLLAAAIGAVVIVGWMLDQPSLRSVLPGAVEMKANTAVALLLAAVASLVAASRRGVDRTKWSVALGWVVAAIGVATLCEYAFHVDLGIDELLVRDTGAAFNQAKGRMSPYSAAAFVALGLGLAGLPRPSLAAAVRLLAGVTMAIGIVSAVGYLWNATEIITDRVAPPVAINTACAFMLLGYAQLQISLARAGLVGSVHSSRLERLILGGFIPVAVLAVIGAGFTYQSGANFAAAAERIAHTQEVRAEIGRVYAAVVDAEVAERDAILVDDVSVKAAYDERERQARERVAALAGLIQDNPEQIARQRRLDVLVREHLAALQQVGEVFEASGRDAARTALASEVGNGRLRQVREVCAEMDAAEAALLRWRDARSQEQRAATLVSLLVTLALLLGLCAVLFRGIRAEIRARAHADERLTELNAELEQRIEARTRELSAQQGFLRRVIDLDRNLIGAKDQDGRFVLVNQALAEVFGISVEGLTGRSERDVRPDAEGIAAREAADRQVRDTGRKLVIDEEAVRDATGNERWLSTVKRPMPSPDGSQTVVLGVSVDITQHKRAEHEIRELNADLERRVALRTAQLSDANQQLEQARIDSEAASRAKSAFLANMSHEIRTPMNAIIGLTHLMLREPQDDAQRDRLDKVVDAAQHLLSIINDILDFSKIEAGKLVLAELEFSIDDVLDNASAMVAATARDKGLELIVDADGLPQRAVGDALRLSQILINLLSNAVKFTERGWVKLRGELVEELPDGIMTRFEVQDTGPGIPLARQALLFSAFEQADNTVTRRYGGTGLGLALTRQLARAMGGEAGVDSAPGAGSRFWFTARLRRSEQPAVRRAPAFVKGLRALLVDDLAEARSVIGDRLRMLGLHVDAVADGPAALARVEAEMAAARPYDVMVIDWRMEPYDGIETLRRLRQLLGDGMPPAVLATAFDDTALAAEARNKGFRAVLLKPVTSSGLHDALAGIFGAPRAQRRTAPVAANDHEAKLRAQHAGQRVLLAEDNPVNRDVAVHLISSAGLIVDTATNGGEAVELTLSRPYDLVLMDMQMPVMDGIEAAGVIRRRSGYAMPIIAMTANAFAEDRQACLDAGMNDHLAKPVDPSTLHAMLLRWLPMRNASDAGRGGDTRPGALPDPDALSGLTLIDGLDVDAALRHVAGQVPALVRVMRLFVETYAAGVPSLLDDSGSISDRVTRWRTACHSVRGAVATIGATQLLDDIAALHDLLTSNAIEEAARQARRLHADLMRLVRAITAAVG